MKPREIGDEVSLYVDLVARVEIEDIIETSTGRRYGVIGVRVQQGGKHAGRQHLRACVIEPAGAAYAHGFNMGRIHAIRWYKRASRKPVIMRNY